MADKFISRDDLIKMIRSSQEQLEIQEQFGELLLRALEEKSDAEEFRTPKKVRISVDDYGTCPTCGNVMRFDGSYRYCNECGQALDWSEVEE